MVSLASDILVFNSKDKTGVTTNQDANYNLIAMGGIGVPPSSVYELLSFHTINHFYNVEAGVNDKIYFIEDAGSLVATLDPGHYTTATLLAEAVSKMGAAGVTTYNVGSLYDANTGKYTFVPAAGNLGFEFLSNSAATARKLLGKDALDDVVAPTQTSDTVADLRLHSNYFIQIPQEGNKHITLLDGSEYSLMVPLNSVFGEHIHHRKQEHYQQLLSFTTNINAMDIKLFTQDGVAIVNMPDYELILRRIF